MAFVPLDGVTSQRTKEIVNQPFSKDALLKCWVHITAIEMLSENIDWKSWDTSRVIYFIVMVRVRMGRVLYSCNL